MFKKITITDLGRPPVTNKSIRLVDDKSYQSGGKKTKTRKTQSKDEIRKKLQGYIECSIPDIPLYSHCRYITCDKENKKPKFCLSKNTYLFYIVHLHI